MTRQSESPGRQRASTPRRRGGRAPRKPRPIMVNAMQVVANRVSALTNAERAAVLAPAIAGVKALREGVATFAQWDDVHGMVLVALSIEAQGVVRGLLEHFKGAERALEAIYRRVNDAPAGPAWGRATTLYFDEIQALSDALQLHDYQLQQLSAAEFQAAVEKVIRLLRAKGGQVVPAASRPAPVQEPLL